MPEMLQSRVRLGSFELDPRAGELHHNGQSTVLQEQQLKVLLMLIERAGGIATREEIRKKLWPNDTVVEFDHSINNAIKNLRRLLGDSADDPKYIATLARRGYRLMVPVEWIVAEPAAADSSEEWPADSSSDASDSGLAAESDSEALPRAKLTVGRLTGKVVSHYRVLEIIGGGGMGLVYRAEDLKLGRAVALKFLPDEVGDDPKARERFEREAHAVSALNHPNICTVYDFDEHKGHPFIAMELLQGKTLRDLLADGRFRLAQPEGLEVAIQIAAGLEAAHEKGIIHRDIKPANIFITEKNVAKILDFGVAKIVQLSESVESPHPGNESRDGAPDEKGRSFSRAVADSISDELGNQSPSGLPPPQDQISGPNGAPEGAALQNQTSLTRTGIQLGTAGYMSPEQIRGERLDARSDIFSFGLVLYEMATGQRAFSAETEAILHDEIQHREPRDVRDFAPAIAGQLETVINQCLQKEPGRRFQSVTEVRCALAEQQHASSPRPQLRPEEQRRKSSRLGLLGMTLAAVLLLAIASPLLYRRMHPTPKLTDKDTIVIADFQNKTGDPVFDTSLYKALALGLEQTPFLNPLTRDKVNRVLKELGHSDSEPLTYERTKEVCAKTNSAALVIGAIADAGNHYKLDLTAVTCDTGAVIARAESVADQRNLIVKELGVAVFALRRQLGEHTKTLQEFSQPLELTTTSSIDALKAFALCDDYHSGGDEANAIEQCRRAVEMDPDFGLAHNLLFAAFSNSGERRLARDEHKKAYELRDRLDRGGRYFVEAGAGDSMHALNELTEFVRTYPNSGDAHNRLSGALRTVGQLEKAAAESRESIRLDPESYWKYGNLMRCEMALERYGEAKAAFEAARARGFDAAPFRHHLYSLAFLQRDTSGMEEQARWAAENPKSAVSGNLLNKEASATRYFGRMSSARRLVDHAAALAHSSGWSEQAAADKSDEAFDESLVGNADLAREAARQALAFNSRDAASPATVTAALAFAFAGDSTKAEELADQISAEWPEGSMQDFELPCIRAAITIRQSKSADAIRILMTPSKYGLAPGNMFASYLRGLAYLQLSQGQQAATEFQRLIEHPGIVGISLTGALARLQLARAQEMMGDTESARKSYQDFLTLWKDADPDIPIYKQAKAEYAKLK